jgi:hypothetical protein
MLIIEQAACPNYGIYKANLLFLSSGQLRSAAGPVSERFNSKRRKNAEEPDIETFLTENFGQQPRFVNLQSRNVGLQSHDVGLQSDDVG